jgi:hypothetical protein
MKNHLSFRTSTHPLSYKFSETENPLGIGKINYLWDLDRSQLVLIMESDQIFNKELNLMIKGSSLMIEAPIIATYNKPLKMRLYDWEIQDDFETGALDIGFSEVQLKPGYHYSLISYQVLDPYLLKVILAYNSIDINGNN